MDMGTCICFKSSRSDHHSCLEWGENPFYGTCEGDDDVDDATTKVSDIFHQGVDDVVTKTWWCSDQILFLWTMYYVGSSCEDVDVFGYYQGVDDVVTKGLTMFF